MSRALSRSLAVVALLAVVSAALVVVTPSLARIGGQDRPHRAPQPAWLWESHVYGGTPDAPAATPDVTSTTAAKPHAKRDRRPYKPPVDRWSQP
jgi:hypothetical protein